MLILKSDIAPVIKTWATRREDAEDDGFDATTLEIYRRVTAAERQQHRVSQTLHAALWGGHGHVVQHAELPAPLSDRVAYRKAAVRLILDLHGLDTRCGISELERIEKATPPQRTTRAPRFAHLGKGRWQATDGAAWYAAGRTAIELLNAAAGDVLSAYPYGESAWAGEVLEILAEDPAVAPWATAFAEAALRTIMEKYAACADGSMLVGTDAAGVPYVELTRGMLVSWAKGWAAVLTATEALRP